MAASMLRVRAAYVAGKGVRVVFVDPCRTASGDRYTERAQRTLSLIARATQRCRVTVVNRHTVVLEGQAGNPLVNETSALRATLRGASSRPAEERAEPAAPAERRLALQRYFIWRHVGSQAERVTSVSECGGAVFTVDVQLAITGGFTKQDWQQLEEVAASLPNGEVLAADNTFDVFVRYRSNATGDVALANEVSELAEIVGKLL